MRKIGLLIVAGMLACTGCTSLSLEEYTYRQTKTSGEGRDTLVLNALASVAANPDKLPPFALYSGGVSTVTDSVSLNEISLWAPHDLVLQTLGMTASTQPRGQWTVDSAAEFQQLEAIHAACLWALYGRERAEEAYPGRILAAPEANLDNKPHFGVEDRLMKTRPGWIHCGGLKEVPLCARYKAHKGCSWVWVMPEDSESFAQFTLALQDIATLDPFIFAPPPILIQLTSSEITSLPDLTGEKGKKNVGINTTETRFVKKEYKPTIEEEIRKGIEAGEGKTGKVNLTRAEWMAYTEQYDGVRNTSGTSPISPAAAATTLPYRSPTNVLLSATGTGLSIAAPPR